MDRLAVRLRDLIVATDEYRRAEASLLAVGITETATLSELLHRGPLPPSVLVTRLGLASASVTALLDRMATRGLLQRVPNPADRRSVLIVLTPRGRALTEGLFGMFSDDILHAVEDSRPEHLQEFAAALERITSSLHRRTTDRSTMARELTRRIGSPPRPG